MRNILQSHPGEVAREIRARRYEKTESGVYLSGPGVFLGGALKIHDYRDDTDQLCAIDANTLLTEGLVHVVNSILPPSGGYTPITAWYAVPYSGDYTPDASLTAATFAATATEFTNYTNATRLALVVAAAATTPSATTNEVQMQFNPAGGPFNVYGFGILSASAKSAITGKALAAIRLDNPRLNMAVNDKLGIEYVLTAADAG